MLSLQLLCLEHDKYLAVMKIEMDFFKEHLQMEVHNHNKNIIMLVILQHYLK